MLGRHAIAQWAKFVSDYLFDVRIDAYIALNREPEKRELVFVQCLELLNRKALHKV